MKEFLRFFSPSSAHIPFYISLAGVTYPDPSYHLNMNCRSISVIEYVIGGKGYVLADGNYHEVGEDTIYFLKKGEHHEYFSDKKDPFTKIFLNISGRFVKELPSAYHLNDNYFFYCKELRSIFERIPEILQSNRSEVEMQAALQGTLTEILTRLSFEKSKEQCSYEAIQLKNYIDANLERLISNSELARIIFRSPDYCQKLFRREFSVTPYAYQLQQKMIRAKYLLSNTQMSVGEIGLALGYSDVHYFSNIFQSKCGCRPLTYRKREQQTK